MANVTPIGLYGGVPKPVADGDKIVDAGGNAFPVTRVMSIKVFSDIEEVATGDGKAIFCIPALFDGYIVTAVAAAITTTSSSGDLTINIRNITNSNVDILSTAITIEASEYTSYSATTAPVINTSNDDLSTGDLVAIDVDAKGTGAKGLEVLLTISKP